MNFDWKDIAQTVIGLGAPSLGLTLGGPLGAAAGKILADALGAPAATPRDVSNVFVSHDTQPSFIVEEAQRAESEWVAALAAIGRAQVVEVGATQHAEIGSDDILQRTWRPIYALELCLEIAAFSSTLLHALWSGHEVGINGFASRC